MAEIDAELLQFDCPNCDRKTDAHSLCAGCESQLTNLLRRVDKTIEWLQIMRDDEVQAIASPGNDTNRFAGVGQAVNLTPAHLVLDELTTLLTTAAETVAGTWTNRPELFKNPTARP